MKKNKYNINYAKDYDIERTASSATECTGLVPAGPITDAQADSYRDIFDVNAKGPQGLSK